MHFLAFILCLVLSCAFGPSHITSARACLPPRGYQCHSFRSKKLKLDVQGDSGLPVAHPSGLLLWLTIFSTVDGIKIDG